MNRAINISFGNNDFQSAIKRKVHNGEYFKAFPTCFNHLTVDIILSTLQTTNAALDVILTEGRECRFGVRTKIFVYPEGMLALWIIIGVIAVGDNL